MALGEVVDKGLDVCRDGLIAPSTVAFIHPVIGILPEWVMHCLTAFLFVVILAIVKDVRRNRHHRHDTDRHIPPHKLRHAPLPG